MTEMPTAQSRAIEKKVQGKTQEQILREIETMAKELEKAEGADAPPVPQMPMEQFVTGNVENSGGGGDEEVDLA
jgi:hypothetical protein